jgi:hypothetical protein
MDGTYGFVYSGAIGIGVGIFTLRTGALEGVDSGGGRYKGTVIEHQETGELEVSFSMFVPAGTLLVQGTSEQDIHYTKAGLTVRTPPKFGDGKPIEVYIPPGNVTVMIKRIPDEYSNFAGGFQITPLSSQ